MRTNTDMKVVAIASFMSKRVAISRSITALREPGLSTGYINLRVTLSPKIQCLEDYLTFFKYILIHYPQCLCLSKCICSFEYLET